MSVTEAITADLLEAFLEAFNRHDVEAVMAFFAEDGTMYLPRGPESWGPRLAGKPAVRAGVADRLAGLPDAHYGRDSHWVCGDLGVSKWELTGTLSSGIRLQVRGVDLLQFRDGKIVQEDSYWKIAE